MGEGEVIVHRCDLASLKSVRECSEQLSNSLEKIDILINNAGVMTCPLTRTEDGLEMQIGTNQAWGWERGDCIQPSPWGHSHRPGSACQRYFWTHRLLYGSSCEAFHQDCGEWSPDDNILCSGGEDRRTQRQVLLRLQGKGTAAPSRECGGCQEVVGHL